MPDPKELTFLVSTNPSDSRSAANKKRVRSVAALKSWPQRRKKTSEQHDHNAHGGAFVLESAGAGPSRPASLKRKRDAGIAAEQPQVASLPAPPGEQQVPGSFGFQDQSVADEELFERCTRAFDTSCMCVHCRTERRYRVEPPQPASHRPVAAHTAKRKRNAEGVIKSSIVEDDLARLTPPLTPSVSPLAVIGNEGRAEPFSCYPVPYRPWFDRILHHMLTVFAPRGWPALKITTAEGLRWEWFMTQQALSDPALFYVRLLFATGDLVRLNVLNRGVSFWLRSQAIKAINEALADPGRATSDALILAVGRIALHENLYGDKHAANTIHRPAQKRMITLRGGMKYLDFPPLVKRLMRWSDKVMAMQSGTDRLLEDEDEIGNFTMKQHVDVLEKWVPTEGRNLRKKIKISDLLSSDGRTPANEPIATPRPEDRIQTSTS